MSSTLGAPALYILLALLAGERHGYAIMKEVARISDDEVTLGPATLYTTIKRLLLAGYIREVGERADPEAPRRDERRRHYALTGTGRTLVEAEMNRMEQLLTRFKPQNLAL
jgi:DNA-binding PadR family transcriptional regulator